MKPSTAVGKSLMESAHPSAIPAHFARGLVQ